MKLLLVVILAISASTRVARGTYAAVIGLDAAGAEFDNDADSISVGIQSGDATYVTLLHTNVGGMGLSRAAGDSDYFINGGKSQPGCIIDIFGICSHFRAPLYFAESIKNSTGFPTNEYPDIYMGGVVLNTRARGNYTVTTGSYPQFA